MWPGRWDVLSNWSHGGPGAAMTNQIAFMLALCICAGISFDYIANDGAFFFVVLQQFIRLVDFVSFWR